MVLAGRLANAEEIGWPPSWDGDGDEHNARLIVDYLELEAPDWLMAESATRRLLRENRVAVRAVADELGEAGALSGDEVARIVEGHSDASRGRASLARPRDVPRRIAET
jgi:hypothetical protein